MQLIYTNLYMNDLISIFKNDLHKLIKNLEDKKIIKNFNLTNISIDFSSKSKQGDLSSNILLMLMKSNIDKHFDIKSYINDYFNKLKYVEKIEIAKVGFINIMLNKDYLIQLLENLLKDDQQITNKKNKRLINIEFVSANPTGPLHIAHLRGAVLGDVLASILESTGNQVDREYYVNDAGSQIITLGSSLYKRYQQLFNLKIKMLDGEYPGQYLIDIAKKIKILDNDKWIDYQNTNDKDIYFQKFATNILIENIKKDLLLIGISFDKFTFESDIVKSNIINKVFTLLEKKSLIYEGFLKKPLGDDVNWLPRKQLLFKSSEFSDDSDRAFKKSDGKWTYFANDAAYHYNKYLRGYDKLINIWGADHIGYIKRMKSIVNTTSGINNYLDIFICQIVRLIKNEKVLKMSKRDDNFITVKDVYNDVGKNALRYFMISTKSETPIDFNMNKVLEQNKDNPVFYCQYAYARASSVLSKAENIKEISFVFDSFNTFDISTVSSHEWNIILKLLSWPYILQQSADTMQPHRITNFLEDISSSFHSFWNKGKDDNSLRMLDTNDINKTLTKLIWLSVFKKTLKNIFDIIGIDAPENM